jgi:hypothetical protein|tara:strand:+ start:1715 stop:2533 length:819 start_codon:yes stop_codon:yes gene_type:complete
MLKSASRRQVTFGLCSCGAAAVLGGTAHAAPVHQGGCYLAASEYQAIVAPTASEFSFMGHAASAGGGRSGVNAGSSGDRNFDQALAITLAKLSNIFEVLPAFSFFTEENGSINAYSSTQITRRDRPDGSVAYGRNLLKKQLSNETTSIAWVVGVCAHEFAHSLQFKRGTAKVLEDMSGGSVYRTELHADYLAGYFSGTRKLEKPDFPAAELALGMFMVGDTYFDNKGHHGTPAQRGEAVRQGFKQAYEQKASFNDAFDAGFRFAKAQKLQRP